MAVYEVDPLSDARWPAFLERESQASVFHSSPWLKALQLTYGYEPIALTTCPPGRELTNGIVFCRVSTWLTGSRLVSLPFSDHCTPLVHCDSHLREVGMFLSDQMKRQRLKYIEIRASIPSLAAIPCGGESNAFFLHKLDLRPSRDTLLRALHKDSIKRKIQRAEREGLTYEKGSSPSLLRKFYGLFVMTRKKHGLPPSPFRWFQNLADCFASDFQVRIASQGNQPVAGMVTLTYKTTVVYKYGGSDHRLSNLGGVPLLFWRTIEEAKSEGREEFDLGRSDIDNQGLITFKNRWGSTQSGLPYWRLPMPRQSPGNAQKARVMQLAKKVVEISPDYVRIQLGQALYRHLG